MAKQHIKMSRKRKSIIAGLCALTVACTGLAAACAPEEENPPSTAVTAKEDTQLLKNGNFEYFDIPDKAVHLIKNVNSWTLGGDTSVKSGIIGVSKPDWDKLTDKELASTLDYNNDLSTGSDEYVNYNSMRSRDLLYKDNYAATLDGDDVSGSWIEKFDGGYQGYFGIEGTGTDDDPYTLNGERVYKNEDDGEFYFDDAYTELVRKEQIQNPGTHLGNFTDTDGVLKFGDTTVYKDDKGFYYTNDKFTGEAVGNVLMIHNTATDTKNNGVHQYYTSSSITLEAKTSAEISLWVKTSDLKFDKGYLANGDEQDKGAYIEVVQSVASTTLDAFRISAINTQKIIDGANASGVTTTESNGWLKYTVYVNACDFADSSIQIRLGLGGSENNEKVSGYAFFDDVQVTKYRDLEAADTDCTYNANKNNISERKTSCTLTSEEDDKIFYADVATHGVTDDRHAYDFNYLIDLASENGVDGTYSALKFGTGGDKIVYTKAGLTVEKNSRGIEYAAATSISANAKYDDVHLKSQPNLQLPKDVNARPTEHDIIGAYDLDKVFTSSDFAGRDDSEYLNNGLKGVDKLPAKAGGNMLVIYSAWGVPYTVTLDNSTATDDTKFTLGRNEYRLVSFWVKTSDMDGSTALTAKIYELDGTEINEDSAQTITIDTTGQTTDFQKEKDIYEGWVQCFFFIKNETDSAADKNFYIDFSFGETAITTAESFESGFVAIANLQILTVNEEIYNLASSGSSTALFSFEGAKDEDNDNVLDNATSTSDIEKGIAIPDQYSGRNGANASGKTSNDLAGLINKDVFNDTENKYAMTAEYKIEILTSFISAAANWNEVFGENCYQPLIIINQLRQYADLAHATADNYEYYYILLDDESTETDGIIMVGNKRYKSAKGTEYSEDETYYSLPKVVNYGFVGESKTVSADGREVVSVRVKVTGDAVAYVYLIDGDDSNKIFSYTTPAYTFYYDEEGNVLDEKLDEDWTTAEHRTHIIYTLRNDGLYDGGDGKAYANLYNLVKTYKDSKYEHDTFYDETGKQVSFDDLKDGETYYKSADASENNIVDHYLCNSKGTQVYEYIDGKYYYIEDNKTTTTEVTKFDIKYARYSYPDIDKELMAEITADDCKTAANGGLGDEDGWVTVNFVIQAGSEAKDYRLELWSGKRDETGVDADGNMEKSGAVAFDYSHATVSDTRLAAYEKEIITAYANAIKEYDDALPEGGEKLMDKIPTGTKENILSYEKLLNDLPEETRKLIEDKVKNPQNGQTGYDYEAYYYTYTLYDAASYIPFNANTANDGETGYDYDSSSFTEQLAYFKFNDVSRHEMNVFVDYKAVDQDITLDTVDDPDDDEEEETRDTSAYGLYISSIVLVAVLIATLISIFVTQYIKNKKKKTNAKNSEKNVYRKRDRYVRKLRLTKNEEEPDEVGDNAETPDGNSVVDTETTAEISEETAAEPSSDASTDEASAEATDPVPEGKPAEAENTEEDKKPNEE